MPNVMAAQPNTEGAVCKSSVIPFLVPRHKVWLTPDGVPCSNAANIGERKTWTQSEFCTWQNSVRGQEPPKMYIRLKISKGKRIKKRKEEGTRRQKKKKPQYENIMAYPIP